MKPEELRKELKRLGWTVPELAEELGVHESAVYRWLDESRRMPVATAKYIRILKPRKAVKA